LSNLPRADSDCISADARRVFNPAGRLFRAIRRGLRPIEPKAAEMPPRSWFLAEVEGFVGTDHDPDFS
jgi:hypothetical protein